MFRRTSIRIISNQLQTLTNNCNRHGAFLSKRFSQHHQSTSNTSVENEYVNLFFHANAANKTGSFPWGAPDSVCQKYFESLVSKCEEDGNIHTLHNQETGELVGCAVTLPCTKQNSTSSHWQPFHQESKSNGFTQIEKEMIELDSHLRDHTVDVADNNSFDGEHDVHVLQYI
eukprot:743885_1